MILNFFFVTYIFINIFFLFKFDLYSKLFTIEDKPNHERKLHKKNTKVLGGTIIIINLLLYGLYFFIFDKSYLIEIFNGQNKIFFFTLAATFIYILGLVDDKYDLPALNKLLFLVLIISTSLFFDKNLIKEINLSFLDNKIYLGELSFFFTLFSYIIFINAFNMLDGINLQAGMYSCFILTVLILLGMDLLLGLTIIFSVLVFLKLNYQNKIFLGDNGTMLLSYIFSYFFIDMYNQQKIIYSDTIFLILIIPGLEIIRLTFERFKANKNILKPDRNHIHHIISFKKNTYLGVFLIHLILIFPFLLSTIYTNNLSIIICTTIFYFLLVFLFKNK
jgi:UDP-GlcNAc:undecaprenyl-phosphate GlcNAc-1-phosphate transferase